MPSPANSTLRRSLYLGITCIALGALCSGVKGGGVLFGAIGGAVLFGAIGSVGLLIAWLTNA